MNNKMFGLAALAVVAVSVGTASQLMKTDSSCGALTATDAVPAGTVEHTVAVELAGNTEEWQREVGRFVQNELDESAAVSPTTPLLVKVLFERNGKVARASNECLREPLLLRPAEQDLATYKAGSEKTKEVTLATMRKTRSSKIGTIVDAVAEEVAGMSFADTKGTPALTVLPLWAAAADGSEPDIVQRWVSVLSPLHSNVDDCLNPNGKDVSADELVADCVSFEELPVVEDAHVRVAFVRSLITSARQRQQAEGVAVALCAHAAADKCAPVETADVAASLAAKGAAS